MTYAHGVFHFIYKTTNLIFVKKKYLNNLKNKITKYNGWNIHIMIFSWNEDDRFCDKFEQSTNTIGFYSFFMEILL